MNWQTQITSLENNTINGYIAGNHIEELVNELKKIKPNCNSSQDICANIIAAVKQFIERLRGDASPLARRRVELVNTLLASLNSNNYTNNRTNDHHVFFEFFIEQKWSAELGLLFDSFLKIKHFYLGQNVIPTVKLALEGLIKFDNRNDLLTAAKFLIGEFDNYSSYKLELFIHCLRFTYDKKLFDIHELLCRTWFQDSRHFELNNCIIETLAASGKSALIFELVREKYGFLEENNLDSAITGLQVSLGMTNIEVRKLLAIKQIISELKSNPSFASKTLTQKDHYFYRDAQKDFSTEKQDFMITKVIAIADRVLRKALLLDIVYRQSYLGDFLWEKNRHDFFTPTPSLKRGALNKAVMELDNLGVDVAKLKGCETFSKGIITNSYPSKTTLATFWPKPQKEAFEQIQREKRQEQERKNRGTMGNNH